MKVESCKLKDVFVIQPQIFEDERGYFFESFNNKKFEDLTGIKTSFVQDNQSKSKIDVVRGMHFQNPPFAQQKLVRVLQGSILDVVLDIRSNSPTYGEYFTVELSSSNLKQIYVPAGFAHGFKTLEDDTIIVYKCSDYYHPESEQTILWNDPTIQMDWNIKNPIVSEKDKNGRNFDEFQSPF